MRILAEVVLGLVAAGAIVMIAGRLLRPPRRWEPVERLDGDGTLNIGVARGSEFRTVKAIPRGEDEIDVLSDVRIAKRDAADLAAELNRRAS